MMGTITTSQAPQGWRYLNVTARQLATGVIKGRAVESWPLGPSGLLRLRQGFIDAEEHLDTENLALVMVQAKGTAVSLCFE